MMTAAVWTGPGMIEVRRVALPELEDGWVRIRVAYTGLCGTDFAIVSGKHPRAKAPLILGHELSGTVVESRSELRIGERVIAEPLISCGRCRACQSGNTHVCRNLELYGIDAPGSLAEFVDLPAKSLLVVPAGIDLEIATLAEPLAVAVHAVGRSGLSRGDTVLVFGAGPIGILIGLVAQSEGAGEILFVEPNEWRRTVAADLGFEAVAEAASIRNHLMDLTGGEGADVVFDAAGHPTVTPHLTDLARVLGSIVVVGVHKEPAAIDLRHINFAEQTIRGVRVYTRADVERAVQLLASGELGLERIPVRIFPLDHAAEALRVASTGEHNLKVLVGSGGAR